MPIVAAILIFAFVIIIFALFVFLEVFALKRLEGWWRRIALIPAAALVAIIVFIVGGIIYDPTAHNLWPFEILIWSAGGSAFLGLLFLVKKIVA